MTTFRISGIWKRDNVITDYAVHEVTSAGTTRAVKTSKRAAITLVEKSGNDTTTWTWNYTHARWDIGENVRVATRNGEKYLRTDQDNTMRDNLSNLIDYNWIKP